MALPCGTKAETALPDEAGRPETVASRFWRGLGFVTMTAAALVIVAAVMLLGPYARLQRMQYQRDLQAVKLQEATYTAETMDRLLADAPADEVLTKRLAWSRLGMYPSRETVVLDPSLPSAPVPGAITPVELASPSPPNETIQATARRLESPQKRRGLLILSASLMVGAVLIFGPSRMRMTRRKGLVPPQITLEAKQEQKRQQKQQQKPRV